MNILGVETSCDETSAAVVQDGNNILSNIVSSQIEVHRPYGGVVPELASRNHLQLIDTVTREAIARSGKTVREMDAVAVTYGPGLAASLLIGLNMAKGIALASGVPLVGVNHVEAHLYSPLLAGDVEEMFPMIALIVSGGHTILAETTAVGCHEILGLTLDDAAGEAFDKVARLLGLGYPGGPEIEQQAKRGRADAIPFPRSMLDDPSYNFSFSGLKTAVLYFLRKNDGYRVEDVCASFQEAAVDVLVEKTVRGAIERKVKCVSVSGGVSVNGRLREKLRARCQENGLQLRLVDPSLCTDNAAMIAGLAYYQLRAGRRADYSLEVAPSIGLGV